MWGAVDFPEVICQAEDGDSLCRRLGSSPRQNQAWPTRAGVQWQGGATSVGGTREKTIPLRLIPGDDAPLSTVTSSGRLRRRSGGDYAAGGHLHTPGPGSNGKNRTWARSGGSAPQSRASGDKAF